MGKKDKNKKKGKGAEKTAAKTEKKLSNKQKKELASHGEDDIEKIVAQIEAEEKKLSKVIERSIETPSRRVNFSLASHPFKDEIILYGGEFFDGQKTFVYNDLLFYNIGNKTWTVVNAPSGPPPRCGHQMIVTSLNKGQLWIFGGEFTSPTQSQFYHYRDLWVYDLEKKQWEKITAPNGPTARSGHRMVYTKRNIIVFGGFYDNLRDYKYYNDLYCFNLDTYKWTKLEPSGIPPAPRSGCCMAALSSGKILIYGGYSKERLKKDVDKGHVFTDSFLLTPEKNDTTGTKWKWSQTKLGGAKFSPRSGLSITTAPNDVAYCFGGVFDEEDEENLSGNFFNELFALDLEKLVWRTITVAEKKPKIVKNEEKVDNQDEMEVDEIKTVSDDGVFKVTVGPSLIAQNVTITNERVDVNEPCPRMNCGLVVKHGTLYLYGGMYEDGDKQITLNDLYALDLKKFDEWKTLMKDDSSKQQWLGSESESSDESEESDTDNPSSDSDMDTE